MISHIQGTRILDSPENDLPHLSEIRADERLCRIKATRDNILDVLLSHCFVMSQQVDRFGFLASFWFGLVELFEHFALFLRVSL